MSGLRLKKGDVVRITAGSFKGKSGKIVATKPRERVVFIEGINMIKRHIKPSQTNPQGGIIDVHKGLDISKVALIHPTKKDSVSRVTFTINKAGVKKRVYKVSNKEIDS